MECGSYTGFKLLDHAMKVVERIFEHRIWQQIDTDDTQKNKGTTDAIFIVRQMQEKFKAKRKKLCFGFVDLEKAFDKVPRDVIKWAMRKLGVKEWLVLAVMSMYTGVKTVVRTIYGNSNSFEVKVIMHQGSALSPLLFVIVTHTHTHTYTIVLLLFWNLSRTTRVSRYQNGKNQEGKTNLDLLEQEIVSGSGICWAICKSARHPR